MDDCIDFSIDNEVAVEFLSELVEHLKQTGAPLQVNTSTGEVELGVEGRIYVSFNYVPDEDWGCATAIDRQE